MNITFNQTPLSVEEGLTIGELMQQKDLTGMNGIAVAVNNRVIPKEIWKDTVLHEGDNLLLIGASYGG